jgi:hypothetical protein
MFKVVAQVAHESKMKAGNGKQERIDMNIWTNSKKMLSLPILANKAYVRPTTRRYRQGTRYFPRRDARYGALS